MEIIIYEEGGKKIAELASDSIIINNEQDALDLMVDPALAGARKIIIYQKNIVPDRQNQTFCGRVAPWRSNLHGFSG